MAEWLGLYGWVEIAQMRQTDEAGLRKLIDDAVARDAKRKEGTA